MNIRFQSMILLSIALSSLVQAGYIHGSFSSWSNLPSLPQAQQRMGVAELNGKLYAVGGTDNVFDSPDTNVWVNTPGSGWAQVRGLPQGVEFLGVATAQGKVYAFGGQNSSAAVAGAYEYNPSSPSSGWVAISNLPGPRTYVAAATVSGKVYAISGCAVKDSYAPTNSVYVYNPSSPALGWQSISNLPQGRYLHAAVGREGKIFVTGGQNASLTNWVYDTANPALGWQTASNFPHHLDSHPMVSAYGKLYTLSGVGAGYALTADVIGFDPVHPSNGWTVAGTLSFSTEYHAAATWNDRIVVLGGESMGGAVRLHSSGVSPENLPYTGSVVTIVGDDLGTASDITNVMICGLNNTSFVSRSPTQVVVNAGTGSGLEGWGDVRVYSTSQGVSVKSNCIHYAGAVAATMPANGSNHVARSSDVTAQFASVMNTGTLTSNRFLQTSRKAGFRYGAVSAMSTQAVLNPAFDFGSGDRIVAELTKGIANAAGAGIPWQSWAFYAAAGRGGSFVSGGTKPLNDCYGDLQVGDLNGDRYLDLIITGGGTTAPILTNTVWTNNGNGSFSVAQQIGGRADANFSLSDVDRDGDLDGLFAGLKGTNQLWVNNGAGVFSLAQSMTLEGAYRAVTEDLNGDGWPDLVLVSQTSGGQVWTNNGAGRFGDSGQRLSGANMISVAIGDVTGDGYPDILTGRLDASSLVFTNDGRGSFGNLGSFGDLDSYALLLGDLDRDGKIDVVAGRNSNGIQIFKNDGHGAFTDSGQSLGAYDSIQLADMDGDGDLDIVSGKYLYLNNGAGIFTASSSVDFNGYDFGLDVGDLDNDGDVDVAHIRLNQWTIWLNTAPEMSVLGANGSTIANGEAASSEKGTDFGTVTKGLSVTNTFRITNSGPVTLSITNAWLSGGGAAQFSVVNLPATVAATAAANFSIVMTPTGGTAFAATLTIHNNSTNAPYVINLAGAGYSIYTITASAGPNGSIDPAGAVTVAEGGGKSFVATADPYYWIDGLVTNGVTNAAAAHARAFTSYWSNVHANGTVIVSFAEALASRGTPELWLAQYGWTNDFDYWETNDTDGDAFQAWEEQIAGTDPTSDVSFLRVSGVGVQDSGTALMWDGTFGRVYAIDGNTNPIEPWFELATNLPPTGVWTDTAHGVNGGVNYRLGVEKQ